MECSGDELLLLLLPLLTAANSTPPLHCLAVQHRSCSVAETDCTTTSGSRTCNPHETSDARDWNIPEVVVSLTALPLLLSCQELFAARQRCCVERERATVGPVLVNTCTVIQHSQLHVLH